MGEKLKLRCEDEEDVVVLSSLLQDALVPMAELAWLPAEKCFVFVASRFVWSECIDVTLPAGEAGIECYSRQNFGVTLEGARAVRSRGIDIDDKSRILELLAITAAPGKGAATIELVFAGGAGIRVECERIAVHGQDVGEPWPTLHRPRHPDIEAA
ncbi:MAG: DUF2948 family protein [Candidatus Odyssella sp.]|nr:DUF2948 family protein [Candidatus Odyssella sp.]